MSNATPTALSILQGARDLISEHGYETGVGRGANGEYSLPAAFDEVAMGDPLYTKHNIDADIISAVLGLPPVLDYSDEYYEAKNALLLGGLDRMPQTQEEALASLDAAIASFTPADTAA